MGDLYSDLRDGRNLLRLLEVLSGETLVSWGHQEEVALKIVWGTRQGWP